MDIDETSVETIDAEGTNSSVTFQICKRLGKDELLGSVSRFVQANHTIVFQTHRTSREQISFISATNKWVILLRPVSYEGLVFYEAGRLTNSVPIRLANLVIGQ